MSKFINALAIAAVATAAAAGTPGTAEAKTFRSFHIVKVGHVVKPHHYHYGFYRAAYVAPVYYGAGCSYFYHRWQSSGAWYWKNKYFACKGY